MLVTVILTVVMANSIRSKFWAKFITFIKVICLIHILFLSLIMQVIMNLLHLNQLAKIKFIVRLAISVITQILCSTLLTVRAWMAVHILLMVGLWLWVTNGTKFGTYKDLQSNCYHENPSLQITSHRNKWRHFSCVQSTQMKYSLEMLVCWKGKVVNLVYCQCFKWKIKFNTCHWFITHRKIQSCHLLRVISCICVCFLWKEIWGTLI